MKLCPLIKKERLKGEQEEEEEEKKEKEEKIHFAQFISRAGKEAPYLITP